MCKYTPVFKVTAVYYRIFKRFEVQKIQKLDPLLLSLAHLFLCCLGNCSWSRATVSGE